MTEQELIEMFIKNNRPIQADPTEFTQARVGLIKELLELPSNKRYKLINFERHWSKKNDL